MSNVPRTWYVTFIKEPELPKIANNLSPYTGNDIWPLSVSFQMNRCEKTDEVIYEYKKQIDILVRIPMPNTAYIPAQTIDFETPLTPGLMWNFSMFVSQVELLTQILSKYQPIGTLYINQFKILHKISRGMYNIATFKKNLKVKSSKVRSSLGDALPGMVQMPVDLEQIDTRVRLRKIVKGRSKPYTIGTPIKKKQLYLDIKTAPRYLPILSGIDFLKIRACKGTLAYASSASVDSCSVSDF